MAVKTFKARLRVDATAEAGRLGTPTRLSADVEADAAAGGWFAPTRLLGATLAADSVVAGGMLVRRGMAAGALADAGAQAVRFGRLPVFLAADLGIDATLAATRLGHAPVGLGADLFGDAVLAAAGFHRIVPLTASVAADAAAAGVFPVRLVFLAAAIAGDAVVEGVPRVSHPLAAALAADAELAGDFAFEMPVLRPAAAGEAPGVANLMRNPSLEYAEVGPTDWDASGSTLDRVAGDAWSGGWSAEWTVAAAGSGTLTVRSRDGLGLAGGGFWGGTVALDVPAGASVTARWDALRANGATATGDAATVGETGGWLPVVPPPVEAVVGATLRRIDLVLSVDNTAGSGAVVVRVDGVQVAAYRPGYAAYADGDAGPGHAWTGTPGLSPSVRQPLPGAA